MSKDNTKNVENTNINNCWNENIIHTSLPTWNEFPDIGLYMDQVLVLMEKYIGNIICDYGKEKFLTPSMINNYVKLNVLPAPENKKYTRTHLAYLIIICLMKQSLSISSISNIMKIQLTYRSLEEVYAIFCSCYINTLNNFLKAGSLSLDSLDYRNSNDKLNIPILEIGIISSITKIIAENTLSSLTIKEDVKKEKASSKDKRNDTKPIKEEKKKKKD